jgi:excisionase family DNA binding protein
LSDELRTVPEAASFLRVRVSTLYAWVEERPPRVPFIRLGPRAIRFRQSDLDEWVESQRVGGAA